MFGKNIRYYRLQNGLTQENFASKIGIEKSMLEKYEKNIVAVPDDDLDRIILNLQIPLLQFLSYCEGPVSVKERRLLKGVTGSKLVWEALLSKIEHDVNKYMFLKALFQDEAPIRPFPESQIDAFPSVEAGVQYIKSVLGCEETWIVGNLVYLAESHGIFVMMLDNEVFKDIPSFSSKMDNNLMVIAYNANLSIAEIHLAMAKELIRLMFRIPRGASTEKNLDNIVGHFLFPRAAVFQEVGKKRNNISSAELLFLRQKYRLPVDWILRRLQQEHVISLQYYKNLLVEIADDAVGLDKEKNLSMAPSKTKQLLLRAYGENLINIGKVADILEINYADAEKFCTEGVLIGKNA